MSWICIHRSDNIAERLKSMNIGNRTSQFKGMKKNTRRISETCLVALMRMGTLKSLNYAQGCIETTRKYQRNWGVRYGTLWQTQSEKSARWNPLRGRNRKHQRDANYKQWSSIFQAKQSNASSQKLKTMAPFYDSMGCRFQVGCLAEDLASAQHCQGTLKGRAGFWLLSSEVGLGMSHAFACHEFQCLECVAQELPQSSISSNTRLASVWNHVRLRRKHENEHEPNHLNTREGIGLSFFISTNYKLIWPLILAQTWSQIWESHGIPFHPVIMFLIIAI